MQLFSNLKPFYIALLTIAYFGTFGHADDEFESIATGYLVKTLPLLESHCLNCHDGETKKGELDLERFGTLADVRQEPEIWQKVVEQVETGEMPPKEKKQLSPGQRALLLSWARGYLNVEARANAGDPGPVTLRRLSNAEYGYTIRDLTGIDSLDPASEFPVDSAAGEGFTNTGDALVMSPALLEKYYAAGKGIAEHVVLLEDGFRFAESFTRRDWSNAIVAQIRSIYLEALRAPPIDFSYRSGKEVGAARPSSDSEGRLNHAPYLDAMIAHGDRLAGTGLNPEYLGILAAMLERDHGSSPLLNELQDRIRGAQIGDGKVIAEWISSWQEQLWRFSSVGHLGIIRPWQEPISPMGEQRDLQLPLAPTSGSPDVALEMEMAVGNAGDSENRVIWEQPRIVRPGTASVLLRDVRAVAAAFERHRKATIASLENTLEIAFEARQSGAREIDIDALARRHDADPETLKPLFAWLGIADSASSMLAGNPHADAHGNPSVWHFFSGPNEDDGKWPTIPEQSLLARWLECADPQEAADVAKQIARIGNRSRIWCLNPESEVAPTIDHGNRSIVRLH